MESSSYSQNSELNFWLVLTSFQGLSRQAFIRGDNKVETVQAHLNCGTQCVVAAANIPESIVEQTNNDIWISHDSSQNMRRKHNLLIYSPL